MFEKKLTLSGKIMWIFASLGGVAFAIGFSYVALVSAQELPWLMRVGFAIGAVFGSAWAALGIWTLKKGSINVFQHENVAHALSFGVVLILLIIFLLLGNQIEDRTVAIQMALNGAIFFLIFGIPALFNMRINRTEASLREQMLKLELKMTEIAEKLGHKI